jgi:hypothetical protein
MPQPRRSKTELLEEAGRAAQQQPPPSTQSVGETIVRLRSVEGLNDDAAIRRFSELYEAGYITDEIVPGASEFVKVTQTAHPWLERARAVAQRQVETPVLRAAGALGLGGEERLENIRGRVEQLPESTTADIAGTIGGELPYLIPGYGLASKATTAAINPLLRYLGPLMSGVKQEKRLLTGASVAHDVLTPFLAESVIGAAEGEDPRKRGLLGAGFGAAGAALRPLSPMVKSGLERVFGRWLASPIRDWLKKPGVPAAVRALARYEGVSTREILERTTGEVNEGLQNAGLAPLDFDTIMTPEDVARVSRGPDLDPLAEALENPEKAAASDWWRAYPDIQPSGVPQAEANSETLRAAAETLRGPSQAGNETLEAAMETLLGRGPRVVPGAASTPPPPVEPQLFPFEEAAPDTLVDLPSPVSPSKPVVVTKRKKVAGTKAEAEQPTIETRRAGASGPFYGTHVTAEDAGSVTTTRLPRKGPGVVEFVDREHQGTGAGAPVADALHRGDTRVDVAAWKKEKASRRKPTEERLVEAPTEDRVTAQERINAEILARQAAAAPVVPPSETATFSAKATAAEFVARMREKVRTVEKVNKIRARRALKDDERGALFPKKQRNRSQYSFGYHPDTRMTALGGDLDPARTVTMSHPDGTDTLASGFVDEVYKLKFGHNFLRTPIHATNDPVYIDFLTKAYDSRDMLMNRMTQRFIKRSEKILRRAGIKGTDSDQVGVFLDTVQDLRILPDGSHTYVGALNPRITPKLYAATRGLRRLLDETWRVVTGVDARAYPILRELDLEPSTALFKRIKLAHMGQASQVNTWPIPEQVAVQRLRGLLTFDLSFIPRPSKNNPAAGRWVSTYDLSVLDRYQDGFFPVRPVEHERELLMNDFRDLQRIQSTSGDTNYTRAMTEALQDKQKRLDELAKEELEQVTRAKPSRDIAPTTPSRRTQYLDVDKAGTAKFLYDRNIQQLMQRYFNNIMSKRFFDELYVMYGGAKKAIESRIQTGSVHAASEGRNVIDFMTDIVNNQRGVRGFHEDKWARMLLRSFREARAKYGSSTLRNVPILGRVVGKHPYEIPTQEDISHMMSEVMRYQYVTKLLMSPRFPLVNVTQSLLPWAVTPSGSFARSTAQVMAGPVEVVRAWRTGRPAQRAILQPWHEAMMDGTIGGANQYVIETSSNNFTRLERLLGTPANWTESYNRVSARWIGKQHILNGGAPHSAVRGFHKELRQELAQARSVNDTKTILRLANRYGRAMNDTTNFQMSTLGRPQGYVGSATRRGAGQFKTYTVGLMMYAKDLRHDPWAAAKFATLMFGLGGLTGWFGAKGARIIRNQIIKASGWVPPQGSGFGTLIEAVPLMIPGLPQLASSFDPWNIPASALDAIEFLGGPSFGGAVGAVGRTAYDISQGEYRAATKHIPRALAPAVVQHADTLAETARGYATSKRGKKIAERPWWKTVGRGFGLQPSAESERYQILQDIRAAKIGGHPETVRKLITAARAQGHIITQKDVNRLRR